MCISGASTGIVTEMHVAVERKLRGKDLMESLYTEIGEKRKRPKTTCDKGQRIGITPQEWDADMPMEPQPTEELPRTPGRVSPNPELDTHVEILEFIEERRPIGPDLENKEKEK